MTERNTGGPAFPSDAPQNFEGMTLRDYFAAAFVSSGHVFKSDTPVNTAERVAAQAYQLADAMLEARK